MFPGCALQRHDPPGVYKGQRNRHGRNGLRGHRRVSGGEDHARRAVRDRERACPGAGACGGQFTANTMSMVMEFLGLSPAGLNAIPAEDRPRTTPRAGAVSWSWTSSDATSDHRAIVTREALENGIASVAATGGSTNGVLHLLAIAHEFGVHSTSTNSTQSPTGRRSSPTCSPAVATPPPTCTRPAASGSSRSELLKRPGPDHGDAPTVDGRTIAEIGRTPSRPTARSSSSPSTSRSRRTAAWPS